MKQTHEAGSTRLDKNVDFIKNALFQSNDLKITRQDYKGSRGVLLFLDSLADPELIERNILTPLNRSENEDLDEVFTTLSHKLESDPDKGVQGLLQGSSLYMMEGSDQFYILSTPAKYSRSIKEPENEAIIRGAHTGFIEDLKTNLYLIRKQINSPNLTVRYLSVGKNRNEGPLPYPGFHQF